MTFRHNFAYKEGIFSTQLQCCLRAVLVSVAYVLQILKTLPRHVYFAYLCVCLLIGLFMPYLGNLFFHYHFDFHCN